MVKSELNLPQPYAELSFEPFAQTSEYVGVNRMLVARTLPQHPSQNVADIACGTGLITQLVLEWLMGRPARIIGIDPNEDSLKKAQEKCKSVKQTETRFFQGTAQEADFLIRSGTIDAVYFCNAIHELQQEEEKLAAIASAASILKPGGKLVVNSAFTQEAYPPGSERPWGVWKLEAMRLLKGKRVNKDNSFPLLSLVDYRLLFEKCGLAVEDVRTVTVPLSKDALAKISLYPGFIEGVFQDVQFPQPQSLEEQSYALILALDRIGERFFGGKDVNFALPRNWVEFVAVKPAA